MAVPAAPSRKVRVHSIRTSISALMLLLVSACARGTEPPTAPDPAAGPARLRTLVLMLDGVPFQLVDSLRAAGHFQQFGAPSQVVSSFPSLTGVAFGEVWHETPDGYEDRYFDAGENKIRGGVIEHVVRPGEDHGYHGAIDIQRGGLSAGLTYILPGPFAALELRSLRSSLLEQMQEDETVIAYLISTDALAHRAGREAVVQVLLQVDSIVMQVRRRAPGARVVLFSDHGNDLVPSRRVPIEDALRRSGYEPTRRLDSPEDVVLPRFGLVGSAFLYVAPESEASVSSALAAEEGVDLVIHEEDDGKVHVLSGRGDATIETDARGWIRYRTVSGDPLGLAAAADGMRRSGRADAEGFAPDSAWLEASLSTRYVDSIRRILNAMRTAVRNPASVIVSFEAGYHYGAPAADWLVDVTGTHGSLLTTSSLAFFMQTDGAAPRLLRGRDLRGYLPALESPLVTPSLVRTP